MHILYRNSIIVSVMDKVESLITKSETKLCLGKILEQEFPVII